MFSDNVILKSLFNVLVGLLVDTLVDIPSLVYVPWSGIWSLLRFSTSFPNACFMKPYNTPPALDRPDQAPSPGLPLAVCLWTPPALGPQQEVTSASGLSFQGPPALK